MRRSDLTVEPVASPALKNTWNRIGIASSRITSGCFTICSPWKPNSNTKVVSSAISELGQHVGRRASPADLGFQDHATHDLGNDQGNRDTAPPTGNRVSHGTTIEVMPSSRPTMGV